MLSLDKATEETYHYVWKEILTSFMRTKQGVKKEFIIYNLNEYPNFHDDYYYDNRYYDYVRLSEAYKKHICFINLGVKYRDLFFSLEDLMTKLIEDGFKVDYRVATKYAILNLALSENKIDEYLDEATHLMVLKREN